MVYPSRLLLLKSASNLKWTHFSRNFSPGLFSLLGKWNFQYWTCQSETFKSWNFSVQDLSVLNFSVPDITVQYTEVHFDSFLSGEFTTKAVINPPERKLAKHTSVQWSNELFSPRLFSPRLFSPELYSPRINFMIYFNKWVSFIKHSLLLQNYLIKKKKKSM